MNVEVPTTPPATLASLASPTPPSPVDIRLEEEVTPAAQMEEGGLNFTEALGPTHDTTGDLMRIHGEMRYQSERMFSMEQMINSQKSLIVALHQQVLNVERQLECQPRVAQSIIREPQPEQRQQPRVPQPGATQPGVSLPQAQGFPPQGPPSLGIQNQGLPPQGLPSQGLPPQGRPPQGLPSQGLPPQGLPPQGPNGLAPQEPQPPGPPYEGQSALGTRAKQTNQSTQGARRAAKTKNNI